MLFFLPLRCWVYLLLREFSLITKLFLLNKFPKISNNHEKIQYHQKTLMGSIILLQVTQFIFHIKNETDFLDSHKSSTKYSLHGHKQIVEHLDVKFIV